MTQLLVSVRSAAEALAALVGGADWIDVKEPSRGSLGAADASTIADVLRVVEDRAPVSMACGELSSVEPPGLCRRDMNTSIQLAKCGLAGSGPNWRQHWKGWSNTLPSSCGPVLVAYAEESRVSAPLISDIVSFAIEIRPSAVLIDTAIKNNQSLFDLWKVDKLSAVLRPLTNESIPFAIAGSLRLEQHSALLALNPDWIAVRGAVCDGGRNGVISAEKVRLWKAAILRIQGRLVDNCQ